MALQEPILAALSRKIIKILLRIAAVPDCFSGEVLEPSTKYTRIAFFLLPILSFFPASVADSLQKISLSHYPGR